MSENDSGMVYSVYIPSPTPAVILLIFWSIFYFTAPKELVYNIPADLFICAVIYGVAYLITGGKKVRVRAIDNRQEKFFKENQKEALAQMQQEMNQYITALKAYKEEIESDRLNDVLGKLVVIIKIMLQYTTDNPDQLKSLQKWIDAYIPLFIDLLKVYLKYEKDPTITQEMKDALGEIEKSSHFVQMALEEKLQDLYTEKITDVTADISALDMMLKQE
ncbi:5-bromo-4-chloroindolyl phosphate hydrolysis family protein [Beduini massiliensis]|uniref:5-bromo-4-chloroindolyl phosphate hydrolysis family protein n=1 Tax=Beduini massiliensis TaxID=1585974 RepID=UPI00059A8EBC|nr:5-bromo-4-chloroindolyl phosphate hydrolysis family protein [Beduini massiliensis]